MLEFAAGGVVVERMACLGIGYLFGMVLFAELIVRFRLGKSARSIGSGNPGTANISRQMGLRWGLAVLAGDLLKTGAACWISLALFPALGHIAILWAGLGATLGHDFPLWAQFRGGKGVATTCAFTVLFSPLWGGLCVLLGGAVVLATGYLPVAAVVIAGCALAPGWFLGGAEGLALMLCSLGLTLLCHRHGLQRVFKGEERKALRKKG